MGRWLLLAAAAVALFAVGGCAERRDVAAERELTLWAHAGREAERATLEVQLRRFEAANTGVRVRLTFIPEGAYNGQVQAAALAGRLPDLLELDGPYLYSYAWQRRLRSLDDLLPEALQADLLPSVLAQGTWRGRLYGVGVFDSGLGLWADRRALTAAGVRIPRGPEEAWGAAEFRAALAALAALSPGGQAIDLKLNYTDEWFTYAFSPLIQSAGADLIDRGGGGAAGVLDSPAAVRALSEVQGWIKAGFVDPNLDDAAFALGRVPLAWGGHWNYPAYRAALGDDLLLLPLPRMGPGMVTGQGSWQWSMTRQAGDPELAAALLSFLLQPEQVLEMTAANGAVPATGDAVARSPAYGPGGPLHLFVRQLAGGYSVPRPRTPAYPVITAAFARAFRDIRHGAPVTAALSRAAALIDREMAANRFYPPVESTS
ncbi:MAG: extracellular solute-binding protein [Desulfobacteraceae bacterium]|jgi:multiple sugar transport system substrate-binding protein